jgi:3-hydroxyisobutyrate dehydrogenase-like beta-hydroxyacid dehydrogenase
MNESVKNVSFIGLGVMGYPMAGHLSKAGYSVRVYNRSKDKASKWVEEHGGAQADTPAEAASGADVVFACVGNDDDIRSVTIGSDGAYSGMAAGACFVDHTTASAEVARELSAQADGLGFSFDRVKPVIDSYSRACQLMGPVGNGQLTKMVNQIAIAGLVQGLSEAVNFADKANLDVKQVLDVISKGAAQSWQMENRGVTMYEDKFEFGFAVDWMRKDLGLCLAESNRNGALLPVTALVNQFYASVKARGGGRWDTSSLIRLLRQT